MENIIKNLLLRFYTILKIAKKGFDKKYIFITKPGKEKEIGPGSCVNSLVETF